MVWRGNILKKAEAENFFFWCLKIDHCPSTGFICQFSCKKYDDSNLHSNHDYLPMFLLEKYAETIVCQYKDMQPKGILYATSTRISVFFLCQGFACGLLTGMVANACPHKVSISVPCRKSHAMFYTYILRVHKNL